MFSFHTDVSSWAHDYLAAISVPEVDGFRLLFGFVVYLYKWWFPSYVLQIDVNLSRDSVRLFVFSRHP